MWPGGELVSQPLRTGGEGSPAEVWAHLETVRRALEQALQDWIGRSLVVGVEGEFWSPARCCAGRRGTSGTTSPISISCAGRWAGNPAPERNGVGAASAATDDDER
jgi:hypothetical protein